MLTIIGLDKLIMTTNPPRLFISYSHKDEVHKEEILKHLTILVRSGKLAAWDDRQILPGAEWDSVIKEYLRTYEIIVLLISSDFLASEYCYSKEMKIAIDRHDCSEAIVIPVFVRECNFSGAPFAKLQGLPTDAKPIEDWQSWDKAYTIIAKGIEKVITSMSNRNNH